MSLLALNGKSYTLDETMTVIADDTHVHDIGGIMGGAESGVSETTTDVLVEAAYFTPARIGETGRKLGIKPTLLVVPASLEKLATQMLERELSESSSNELKGKLELVVADYL